MLYKGSGMVGTVSFLFDGGCNVDCVGWKMLNV